MSNLNLRQRTGQLDWNDLRTVLAVARCGSLAGAARELGVRHSTVFRRMEQVERGLGARLFERSRQGWSANAEGEAVARAAAEMELAALAAERTIKGADARLQGPVRIATSELLASYLLPPLLARFLAAHPGVELEVTASNRSVDLTRREADLALRATAEPPQVLVGRRIAVMHYALYASKALVGRRRRSALDLRQLPWIGFDESISSFQIAKWVRETLPEVVPRLRMDSLPAMLQATVAGAGVAALPLYAGAQHPGLVRVSPPIQGPEMGLWILSHPDVRGNARIRALVAFLVEAVPQELGRFAASDATREPLAVFAPRTNGRARKSRLPTVS